MALTREQFAQGGDGSGTSRNIDFANDIVAGETVVVMAGYNQSPGTNPGTCADENGVNIPRIASLQHTGTNIVHDMFVLHNHPGSANRLVYSPGLSVAYLSGCAWRVSSSAGTIDTRDFSTQQQTNTAAGTDAVSSGVMDVEVGDLILGLSFNNTGGSALLSAGTGFNAAGANGGAVGGFALAISRASAASGTAAALWTITSGNTDEHTASGIVLREVVAGGNRRRRLLLAA